MDYYSSYIKLERIEMMILNQFINLLTVINTQGIAVNQAQSFNNNK